MYQNYMYRGFDHPMAVGDGGILGIAIHFLTWALLIMGIVWIVRNISHGRHHYRFTGGEDVLEIIKQRYAKGELTKAEFEAMKKDLS